MRKYVFWRKKFFPEQSLRGCKKGKMAEISRNGRYFSGAHSSVGMADGAGLEKLRRKRDENSKRLSAVRALLVQENENKGRSFCVGTGSGDSKTALLRRKGRENVVSSKQNLPGHASCRPKHVLCFRAGLLPGEAHAVDCRIAESFPLRVQERCGRKSG